MSCRFQVLSDDAENPTCETIGYLHGKENFDPAIKDSDIEGTDGEIVLPDQVDGQVEGEAARTYRLTTIGPYSFARLRNIRGTGLAANRSVTLIGDDAYIESSVVSTGLAENASVKTIGANGFYLCGNLLSTGLSGNSTVTEIGEQAFLGCAVLTDTGLAGNETLTLSIHNKEGIVEESRGVFWHCEALRDTGLGDNTHLTTLPEGTFNYCYKLEQTGLDRNTTLKTIGRLAFANCSAVDPGTKVPLSGLRTTGLESNSTVKELGNQVFYLCQNLISTGLESNSTIEELPAGAFQNCTALLSTGLVRNRTVTSIGNNAFFLDRALGTKEVASEPVNVGDLLLSQPDQGGSLKIGSSAFSGTGYARVYLLYDKSAITMEESSLPGDATLYVPGASWQGTKIYPSSYGPFKVSDGSLVVMSPAIEDMSARRKEGTSDGALVTFVTNHSFKVQMSHARPGEEPAPIRKGAEIAVDKGGSESLTGVEVDLGEKTGLSTLPEQLTATIVGPGSFVYPEGATDRGYNSASSGGAAGGSCDLAAVSFTVGFDANGGRESGGHGMADVAEVCGVPSALPRCTYVAADDAHYRFGSWNTSADGRGESFAERADGSEVSKIQGQRVVLYAQWVSRVSMSLTVTCKDEGGGGLAGVGFLLAHSDDPHDIAREVCTDSSELHPVGDDWPQLSGAGGVMSLYGLKPGEYHVFNIRAAAGYQASVEVHIIKISEDGNAWLDGVPVHSVAQYNIRVGYAFSRLPVLPSAGMLASIPARSLGVTAALLGCTAMVWRARRRFGREA